MSDTCRVCGKAVYEYEQHVLVRGDARLPHCSQACLRTAVNVARRARRKAQLRWGGWTLVALVTLAGGLWLRQHLVSRRPPAEPPRPAPRAQAPAEPPRFGPSWPPTDDVWREQLAHVPWIHPLPGPERREPTSCRQIFAPPPKGGAGARCRDAGRCGVDLGGEPWGEHVYAAFDGVIDRVQRSAEASGGVSVRIAHLGGVVFTHYFHLAAVPTRLHAGQRVSAGDVIGLVGDTGLAGERARLHFALSIQPATTLEEVYWDPAPLLPSWALSTPPRGSVTGLATVDAPAEHVPGTLLTRQPAPAPPPRHRRAE